MSERKNGGLADAPDDRLFRHVTHAALLLVLLGTVWLLVQQETLPGGAELALAGGLFCLGGTTSLANVFLSPLPRLAEEKGRTPLRYQQGGPLLLFLLSGVLLALEVSVAAEGGAVQNAALAALCASAASCTSVLYARQVVCWHEEGIILRTALGSIRRLGWEQMTGFAANRRWHMTSMSADGKVYMLRLNAAQQSSFLRFANKQRAAMGLPPVPWA